jgi:hypothetical protein
MALFLTDLSDGPSRRTISGLFLFDKVRKQGNTLGKIHTKGFIGQNSRFHRVEMRDFDSITQITDLRSRVNSGITMLNQILKDGMLLDMFVYISFECPATSLTIVVKAAQRSFRLASGIVDIIGPEKVSNECIPRLAPITSLRVWLQI